MDTQIEQLEAEIERLRSLVRFQDNVIRSGDTATLTEDERKALQSLLERFPKHDS